MAQSLVNVLYNALLQIANIILFPIDILITNFFPDSYTQINILNNFINTYINGTITWFVNFLPNSLVQTCLFCLDSTIALYTITLGCWAFVKILSIIRKVRL